ncbi:hypothetical protein N8878_03720 [Psychromonas sp.]|nr:hypothetical protein [Psychromonas sp.]
MSGTKKPTEAELQEWLNGVHFGSCCRDPLPSERKSASKDLSNPTSDKPVKQNNVSK